MTEADQSQLRATFNTVAERYDRVRPGYPAELFDDLAEAGIGPGSRVLEIGPGTGQATVELARRGYHVVGVELGAELAAVARRNLAGFGEAAIEDAAFEEWPLPGEPFDLVFAATAFHWIDPAVRISKSADALRMGGLLATVMTHHVDGGTSRFFVEVQDCYERFDPAAEPGLRLPAASAVPRDDAELTSSGRFGPATFRRYEWELSYTTERYVELQLTYSPNLAMPEVQRSDLMACIAGLIDGSYHGRVTKRYMTELRFAPRTA